MSHWQAFPTNVGPNVLEPDVAGRKSVSDTLLHSTRGPRAAVLTCDAIIARRLRMTYS